MARPVRTSKRPAVPTVSCTSDPRSGIVCLSLILPGSGSSSRRVRRVDLVANLREMCGAARVDLSAIKRCEGDAWGDFGGLVTGEKKRGASVAGLSGLGKLVAAVVAVNPFDGPG